MENKKKQILLVIGIVAMLLVVGGATYAFFVAQNNGSDIKNVDITTGTVDSLTFNVSDNIVITANQTDFVEGGRNHFGEVTATAALTANNTTNSANGNYYLYLDINKNNFVYSTEAQTAELILTITKPDNTILTTLEGYDYVTVGSGDKQVSGFDITESTDLIKIADNYAITATSTSAAKQVWKIKITLANLDANQNANAGKNFEAEIKMQKEEIGNLFASYIKSQYITQGANGLYLHDATLENGANDGSYRYAGGDYVFTPDATDAGYTTYLQAIADWNITNDYAGTLVLGVCPGGLMGSLCQNGNYYYYLQYDEAKNHYPSYEAALIQAARDGYVKKDNVKNFVCFGSDDATCPEDNLYRILGVYKDKVKLIKYSYPNTSLLGENGNYHGTYSGFLLDRRGSVNNISYLYKWNKDDNPYNYNETDYYNVWANSNLNKINLNTNFINNIGEKWSSLITNNNYVVGGNTFDNLYKVTISTAYQNEIVNPLEEVPKYYKGRVGLMYLSDFGYAMDPSNWTTVLARISSANAISKNWLFMANSEFTITRISDGEYNDYVLTLSDYGKPTESPLPVFSVRPVFYLSNGTQYVSGSGTMSDPYRIA